MDQAAAWAKTVVVGTLFAGIVAALAAAYDHRYALYPRGAVATSR